MNPDRSISVGTIIKDISCVSSRTGLAPILIRRSRCSNSKVELISKASLRLISKITWFHHFQVIFLFRVSLAPQISFPMLPLNIEVKLRGNFSCAKLSSLLQGRRHSYLFGSSPNFRDNFREGFKSFASRKSERKRRKDREVPQITLLTENIRDAGGEEAPTSTELPSGTRSGVQVEVASRNAVLQACILTSAGLLLFGFLIRQVSHLAYTKGLPIHDATEVLKFEFETWHIELVLLLVVLISSSRYILLKACPDFAESSEAANQQVLGSLEPLDLLVVALLPGISEELLFRGGLMPLFGLDWKSALVAGAIFGILHLNGGRKYSYAIWATIVGFAYGLATVTSSSLVVPMASHSLNNLIGGLVWYLNSNSISKKKLK